MQAALRTKLTYHRAPPGLAARIGAALPREAPPPVIAGQVCAAGFPCRHSAWLERVLPVRWRGWRSLSR